MRLREHRDLEVVAVAAVACALIAVAVPVEAISILAAAPLVLLLSGYAITAAAFGPRQLPGPQLIVLSLGNSLAALVLGSLLLNYVPGGIREASWAPLLVCLVLAACEAGARRREGHSEWTSLPALRLRFSGSDRLLALGAGVAVVAALLLAWTVLPAKHALGYTQMWMLPTGNEQRPGMRIGVVSEEQDPTSYEVVLESANNRSIVASGLVLKPGDSRIINVPIARSKQTAPGTRLSAYLYRSDRLQVPYRRVTAYVPSAPSQP
jgi:uncharacterized membrane protein